MAKFCSLRGAKDAFPKVLRCGETNVPLWEDGPTYCTCALFGTHANGYS